MNEETSYRLFRLIEENPGISQRELAKSMGISLGKTPTTASRARWTKAG